MNLRSFLLHLFSIRSSDAYIKYLRRSGVSIGTGCQFRCPRTTKIDPSRPWLITIGNHVDFNNNFILWTHDWCSHVFLEKFGRMVNSSGRVIIGNNVYFGTNVIVLKGVRIGDNCIIGAGSVVSKDIPDNSVAIGYPCKRICSIDEYYEHRKSVGLAEAIDNVLAIKERFGRHPTKSELWEEAIYWDGHMFGKTEWRGYFENHFKSMEEFINFCYEQGKEENCSCNSDIQS